MNSPARLLVDYTHLGRTVTGLERITLELFSGEALEPLVLEPVSGGFKLRMVLEQQLGIPLRLVADPRAFLLAPGFPPSLLSVLVGGSRIVPYIHDCFLIDRPQDLNWKARLYMAPAFKALVRRVPWLLVNSRATAADVARYARPDAEITLYRPQVRDVFGMAPMRDDCVAARRIDVDRRLEVVAVGTVEPRKNYPAAVEIVRRLRDEHGFDATLHIIGRNGWGRTSGQVSGQPGVVVHGYLPSDEVRRLLGRAHVFLSTSHDEGLGLPLLEAQYAGLQVVAPDKPVFNEVLGESGLHIQPADPASAALAIVAWLDEPDPFRRAAEAAADNIARWNRQAAEDRIQVIERLAATAGRIGSLTAAVPPRTP